MIFFISLKISGYQFCAQCAVHLSRQDYHSKVMKES